MRSLVGLSNKCGDSIVGKISHLHLEYTDRKNAILIISSLNDDISGYRAIIVPFELNEKFPVSKKDISIIQNVKDTSSLCDGDIILLDMNRGIITLLHEKQSNHNSIFVTSQCNSSCIMCPQFSKKDSPNSEEINLELIKLIDNSTQAIGVTGGEPFVYKERVINILNQCKNYLPSTQIQILTNGILLKDIEYVKDIAKIGINNLFFCIPIYADTDYEHDFIMQNKGAFENTIQALYNLAACGQLIELRLVMLSLNYKRLPQIAEFFYHNFPFVKHIAFMGMEAEGFAKKNIKELWVNPISYMPNLEKAVNYISQRNIDVSIYNEQLCLLPESLWPFSCKSISDWKNVYLKTCASCKLKKKCGGFFKSIIDEHKNLIKAVH